MSLHLVGMWLQRLAALAGRPTIRVLGAISGTSADAIDIAVCDFDLASSGIGAHRLVAFSEQRYSEDVQKKIRSAESLALQDIAELDLLIGEEFAAAMLKTCAESNIDPASIDLIGSHGQTVYHHSSKPGARRATLQLGCADTIATRCGSPVVFDFRRKDIVLDGEGAPLTPFSDFVLYGQANVKRAILNLGGIANITVLSSRVEETVGFDTGPANAPLDRIAALISNGALHYDKDGQYARAGTVDPKLLKTLLSSDSYLLQAPPKSTGFEMYGDSFVRSLVAQHGGADAHLMATVTEFVAQSVADAIHRFVKSPLDELVLAGGGAKNPALVDALAKALSPLRVITSDTVGIPASAREAIGFAVLAAYAVCEWPNSITSVTGASRPACLGKIATPT